MLKEQVLKKWKELKDKIQTFILSPSEKKDFAFLENSISGSYCSFDIDHKVSDEKLTELEKKVRSEQETISLMDTENIILVNFQIACGAHCSTILRLINLEKRNREYKQENLRLSDTGPTIEEVD